MTILEKKKNIFELDPKEYYFAHCISSDCKMGAGIAVEFKRKFKLASLKNEVCSELLESPTCIVKGRVFNLITKQVYSGKPTYESLKASLEIMRIIVVERKIKKLAMPKIGCGLDKLQWGKVREILQEVFEDVDVDITVCYL